MNTYTGKNPTGWLMSEKYDGVQGIWNGREMKTRTGNFILCPQFIRETLPKPKSRPLIGELWTGRGEFDIVRATVCARRPDLEKWRRIRFMVFDGGQDDMGPFAENIRQTQVESTEHMDAFYNRIVADGGEGVVLTDNEGNTMKRKPCMDDDGVLTGYTEGKGKYAGLIGSFIVKLRSGKILKIGGIHYSLRNSPPEIGSVIRFSYRGFTPNGLPRHAAFSGVRAESSLCF